MSEYVVCNRVLNLDSIKFFYKKLIIFFFMLLDGLDAMSINIHIFSCMSMQLLINYTDLAKKPRKLDILLYIND